jgi:hypothetical protein
LSSYVQMPIVKEKMARPVNMFFTRYGFLARRSAADWR